MKAGFFYPKCFTSYKLNFYLNRELERSKFSNKCFGEPMCYNKTNEKKIICSTFSCHCGIYTQFLSPTNHQFDPPHSYNNSSCGFLLKFHFFPCPVKVKVLPIGSCNDGDGVTFEIYWNIANKI